MSEKLQKLLAARGLTSRRDAETWILAGRVTVNGAVAGLGDRADPLTDRIEVDGKPLPSREEERNFLFYKPRGVVTSLRDEKGRPDLRRFTRDLGLRLFPVGRLDMESEGLLLLTNDGAYANRCAHPSRAVIKAYRVWVKPWSEGALDRLRQVIPLDDGEVQADYVRLLGTTGDTAELLIGIHQGKNRQIRRMCGFSALKVTRLCRVAEGALTIGNLGPGEIKELTKGEAEQVFLELDPESLYRLGGNHG